MIRPTTLGFLVLAGVAGGMLFHVSDGARALKDELKSLDRQFATDTDEMHVLRAEWAYLNQPARLEELARRHLGLQPMTGAQVIRMEMLPLRTLPAAAPIADPTPPALVLIEAVAVAPQPAKLPNRARAAAIMPLPKPPSPALIEAVAAAPKPAGIPSRPRFAAVIPRPKPAAPARSVLAPAPRAADRSLDDVLAELLSPAPEAAR